MTKFSDEEAKLSKFLHRYRPVPPPAGANLEARLMQNLPPKPKNANYRWLIPTALAAGLLATWTGYQTFNPSLMYGENNQELEAFLINSWDETLKTEMTNTEW